MRLRRREGVRRVEEQRRLYQGSIGSLKAL
jgi:hypothetical protein